MPLMRTVALACVFVFMMFPARAFAQRGEAVAIVEAVVEYTAQETDARTVYLDPSRFHAALPDSVLRSVVASTALVKLGRVPEIAECDYSISPFESEACTLPKDAVVLLISEPRIEGGQAAIEFTWSASEDDHGFHVVAYRAELAKRGGSWTVIRARVVGAS